MTEDQQKELAARQRRAARKIVNILAEENLTINDLDLFWQVFVWPRLAGQKIMPLSED